MMQLGIKVRVHHRRDQRTIIWSGEWYGPIEAGTRFALSNKIYSITGHYVEVVRGEAITRVEVRG